MVCLALLGGLACSGSGGGELESQRDVEDLLDAVADELVDLVARADESASGLRSTRLARGGSALVDCPRKGAATVRFDDGRIDLDSCGLSAVTVTGTVMFTSGALATGRQVRVVGALEVEGAWSGSVAIRSLTITRDSAAAETCYSGSVLLGDEVVAVKSASISCAGHQRSCDALFGQPPSFSFDRQRIPPSLTDPAITLRDGVRHEVMVPRHGVPPRDELFVFLPGTNATPSNYSHILRAGTFAGYRSVGLAYENTNTISSYCDALAETDPDCSHDTRQENQTGADLSDLIKVDVANSIEHRLLALLEFLDANDPTGGWGAYYGAGEILWSSIVIGGHSQGAGQSALIARDHRVARAIYFSNPGDAYPIDTKAVPPIYGLDPWTAEAKKTPPEAQYSLHHAAEASSFWVPQVFEAIGLSRLGPIVDSTDSEPLYQCSHTLSMSHPAGDFGEAHRQTAFDNDVPLTSSGMPLYNNAYLYLLTAAPTM